MPRQDAWSDEEMLEALDMYAHDGLNTTQIGKQTGRGRNSVIGMFNRVKKETDKHDLSPELNGTMPRGWWTR